MDFPYSNCSALKPVVAPSQSPHYMAPHWSISYVRVCGLFCPIASAAYSIGGFILIKIILKFGRYAKMIRMKKALFALLIALLLFTGIGALYSHVFAPCSQPVSYSIGALDPRFKITPETALKEAKAAEAIWEKAAGKNLFDYNPNSAFKINFIYDDRQARTDELKQLTGDLQITEKQYESIGQQSTALARDYDAKHAAYIAASAKLQSDLDQYNKEVDTWNTQGGAPPAEYAKLQAEKAALNQRAAELETSRQNLNALASQINLLANKGQNIAADYNSNVSTYNQKFGTSTVFDEGIYSGKDINIYQFKGMNDLELVLTHEMGHALGLSHVTDPKSVMYYLMQDQNLNTIALGTADIAELKAVCKLK